MGEILPNGENGWYEGYCPKCHKIIKTNMQGNEIGNHACNTQNKQLMKLEKQDVFIKKGGYNKETDCVLILPNYISSAATCLKDVYVLTETELETLKQEYYGIGFQEGQKSK